MVKKFEYLDRAGLELLVKKFNDKLNANAENDAAIADAVLECFNKVEYDKATKKIVFGNTEKEDTKAEIDATDFIKDGMVSNVEVKDGKLEITFNEDSGQETIQIEISEIFNAENYYTKEEVDNELEGKQDVGDYVEYSEFNGHKVIYLEEDQQIGGLPKAGSGINMLQLRKYDSVEYPTVELGSTSATLTLNAKNGKVAIDGAEKQEIVATVSDIETAKSEIETKIEEATDNVVRYTPFENRKTIALAEGDTISSMGVNFGMVKTYAGLNYPENSGLSGLMPCLEVGGSRGALVLNTCEDRVKVEVVEDGKRVQHPVATVDDFVAITASEIEDMFE